MTTETTLQFERQTCGRCGGTGHYSYCQMHGTTCFGCGGRKVVLTKRGAAASNWFKEQRMVATAELKVGDWIMTGSVTLSGQPYDVKAKIVAIGPSESRYGQRGPDGEMIWQNYTNIDCVDRKGRKYGVGTFPESKHLRLLPTAEHNALLARAIEYQNTLTKMGKPTKRTAEIA